MKTLRLVMPVLLAFLSCFLSSCKDDDEPMPEPTMSVPANVLNLKSFAVDTTLVITSNYEWKVTHPETDTWCKLTKDKEKLHIVLDWNFNTVERSTRVTVTVEAAGMKKEEYIDITQKASDPASVSLSVDQLVFEAGGGTKSVSVLANMPDYTWKLSAVDDAGKVIEGVKVDWCEVVREDFSLKLTVTENPDVTGRKAQLEVIAGQGSNMKSALLTISQQGQQPDIQVQDTIVLSATNETVRLEISTNLPSWTYNYYGNFQKIAIERVEGEDVLLLKGLDFATDIYYGSLEIMAGEGGNAVSKKVIVKKEAAPVATISVDKRNVIFANEGGVIELTVTANLAEWSYIIPEEATWLTVVKEENKLKLTATAGGEDLREAVITLKAGVGSNSRSIELRIRQAGTKSFVSLSEFTLNLDANGTELFVKVESNTGEWKVALAEDAGWCHYRIEGDKLYVSADALEAGSRSTIVTVGTGVSGTEAAADLTVNQTKAYAVGDYYILNDKKLGIVFEVSDGGMHGKVLSLIANHEATLDYANVEGEGSDGDIATNRTDGRENIKAMKVRGNFVNNYPAAAWCDALNDENGMPGWYLPAIEELRTLDLMLSNGEEGGYSEAALARRERINQMITDAGGIPFVFEFVWGEGAPWQLYYLMSSTEEFFQDSATYWLRDLTDGSNMPKMIYSDNHRGAIRPILTF